MDYKALIALLAFIPALAFGQPMSISELAWPNSISPTHDCSEVFASNSIVVLSENSVATIHLRGAGGAYSLLSSPLSGSLSGFDSSGGVVTYTPNANFVGGDSFMFQVQSNLCTTNATVYITVFETNSPTETCLSVTNVTSIETETSECWTHTINGVVVDSGCSTNLTIMSPIFTGEFCTIGTNLCQGQARDFALVSYSTNLVSHSCPDLYSGFKSSGLASGNVLSFGVTNTSGSGNGYVAQDFSFGFCNALNTNKTLHISGLVSWDVVASGGLGVCVYTNGFVCGNGDANALVHSVAIAGHEVSNNIPFTIDVPLIDNHVYPENSLLIEFRVQGPNNPAERKFWGSATISLQ